MISHDRMETWGFADAQDGAEGAGDPAWAPADDGWSSFVRAECAGCAECVVRVEEDSENGPCPTNRSSSTLRAPFLL